MKIYLFPHPDKPKFLGLSTRRRKGFVFSIETQHAKEAIDKFISIGAVASFKEDGISYVESLPYTILSVIRDFIWENHREQGFIEEPQVKLRKKSCP